MSKVQKRTFSLTLDQSAYVDAKVAAGGYASSSEVVREGLRAMQQRDAEIDHWVTEQVLPVARELEAYPERAVAIEDAFEGIYDSIREQKAKNKAS